ncbi:MAG: hypothetical protein AAGI27_16935, partial [Pseudomonadota bacterium]
MRRNALAYLLGIAAAILTIMLVEALGHVVFPVEADIDFEDSEGLANYMATLPLGAVLFVALAWALGVVAGIAVALRIGDLKPVYFSSVITSFVLAGAVSQMILIPHPTWFVPVALIGIVGAGAAANFLP